MKRPLSRGNVQKHAWYQIYSAGCPDQLRTKTILYLEKARATELVEELSPKVYLQYSIEPNIPHTNNAIDATITYKNAVVTPYNGFFFLSLQAVFTSYANGTTHE